MKTLLRYLEKHYGRMGIGFLIKFIGTVAEVLIPYILTYVLQETGTKQMEHILFWGSIMVLCSVLACVLNITANRMASKVSRDFAEAMRRDLFAKTLHLSAAQTDHFTIPSLESRITTDTYNVHHFINMIQRMGVRAPIMLAGGIGITLFMDAKLSLVMIALIPVIFGLVLFIRSNGVPLYTKVQQSADGMIRVVREDVQGIRVIKALSKTDYEHRRYDKVNRTLSKNETRAGMTMGAVHPVMNVFMNMGSVAVISLGAHYIAGGTSTPETIIAFIQYFTQISMALMAVTRMFVMYSKSSASARRIEEVLLAPEDLTVKTKEAYPDIQTEDHIVFRNVSFSYNQKRNDLENISFTLKKGGRLGIIGATGSGKSTLVKLLLRFYDTDSGSIYIDGENIKTIPKPALYTKFGTSLQQDFLYAETVEENIKFGRPISDEQVRKAAKLAQADDFIMGFADGYQHKLSSHGTNISGGQKQRILIARALAGEPEILILDDSSSALDYKTDAALRKALAENRKDTTVVTVAQRVSSVKDCDLILVLEQGAIIGMGSHSELLEKCDAYREISESQMGGAFVE